MIGTATWQRPLHAILEWEQRLASKAGRNPLTTSVYEFIRFGIKQGWACLFGGIMLALLLATHRWYPNDAPLSRYDFLTIAAIIVQIGMLLTGLETWEEAKVILLFHLAGTLMEVFKTAIGSWIYPETSLFHLYGVPLFTGFMYASVGSYIARVWRAFDFRFLDHPSLRSIQILATVTYMNFFAHHWLPDIRLALFAAAAFLFRRTWIYYRIWQTHRRMPLLLGLALVTLFIWFAENIGTFSHAWVYPHQTQEWSPVGTAKLGAWFLLMLISYTLVASVNGITTSRQPLARPLSVGDGRRLSELGAPASELRPTPVDR